MADIAPEPKPADAVAVAYCHSHEVSTCWHHSVIELLAHDLAHHARILAGGWVAVKCGTDGLVEARNMVVKTFLAEKRADWMLWLDTDMGFEPSTVDRLMEVADPVERPMVGALCFSQRELEADGMGGWRTSQTPTIFDWAEIKGQHGFAVRFDYPRQTVTRCAGTGSACLLVHRSVFERVAERFGPVWYNRVPNVETGQLVSEDLSFCLRVGSLNIPVHVHTGVEASHHKAVWLTEDRYVRERVAEAVLQVQREQREAVEAQNGSTPVSRARENARRRLKAAR